MLTINGRGESGQDNFAFEFCGRIANGTFIDIGCNEPRRWNNTYALEEVGWRGVGLDINPDYYFDWKRERKTPFVAADAAKVRWREILHIRNLPLNVDYLSLDIDENHERDLVTTILENLFAAGVSWRCATIEHDAYRFGDHPRLAIRKVMQEAGYTLKHADVEIRTGNGKPFEDWWVRE